MATQFSLSYDGEGNPSLVENKVESKAVTPTGTFNIDPFEPVRTVRTDYTFESVDPFDYEQQLTYLKTFITDNDADPDPGIKDDSFQTLAARDDKGNIIGGLTAIEKAKLAAFKYSQLPTVAKFAISTFTPFGFLGTIANKIGESMLDPYYDPEDPMYDYTGFGADLKEGDVSKPGMGYEAAYGSKFSTTGVVAEASEGAYDPGNTSDTSVAGQGYAAAYGTAEASEGAYSPSNNNTGGNYSTGGSGGGGGGADSGANSATSGSGSTDTCGSS